MEIHYVQKKIQSLKDEIKAIEYTNAMDNLTTSTDASRVNDLHIKIQVLNEIIISYKPNIILKPNKNK
jgi:hypothetical protein